MEISMINRQAGLTKPDLFPVRTGAGSLSSTKLTYSSNRVGFCTTTFKRRCAGVKAVRSEIAVDEKQSPPSISQPNQTGPVRLFVGLPIDSVSDCQTVNHGKAIAAGLKALKLLGADGVDLPVHWSPVQPDSIDRFDWTAYLTLAQMVREAGLQLRVSLNLYPSPFPRFPLPEWLKRVSDSDPDIFVTDRSGRRREGCLSFAADELPVLSGKTPLQAFEAFFASFRDSFSDLFGSVITDVMIGLGPDGELRYPSIPAKDARSKTASVGVGEFQCYDKYMLADLKRHAEKSGQPLWGLGGPHDAPAYNQSPENSGFFKDHGGSWESPYGQFFISWYTDLLLAHGDRVLSIASKVFDVLPVRISGKIALVDAWHRSRARPAELTAGYRDYDAIVRMFAKNSCGVVVPGMEMSDEEQRNGSSSPESVMAEILAACERHGVPVTGENYGAGGFGRIKKCLMSSSAVKTFTYQRMGVEFFSPEHWPQFTAFVRGFAEMELAGDDVVSSGETLTLPMSAAVAPATSARRDEREMQAQAV
ncbi:Beta-amylase protein [Dioscorea alata]|uniref:Beta-amylase protein n=1 Tax=Dioscorea alata TaxID=55571 RepID=A0ACB7V0R5_DIOAL|nr:Beta-amylase protein [Dioscorea alata]